MELSVLGMGHGQEHRASFLQASAPSACVLPPHLDTALLSPGGSQPPWSPGASAGPATRQTADNANKQGLLLDHSALKPALLVLQKKKRTKSGREHTCISKVCFCCLNSAGNNHCCPSHSWPNTTASILWQQPQSPIALPECSRARRWAVCSASLE